jgi:hypothetical protein
VLTNSTNNGPGWVASRVDATNSSSFSSTIGCRRADSGNHKHVQTLTRDMPVITDQQISILCDLGQSPIFALAFEKKRELDKLIADGFVELSDSGSLGNYKLTAKGETILADRGAGLNES